MRRTETQAPAPVPDAGASRPAGLQPLCPPDNPFCAANPGATPDPATIPTVDTCEAQPIDLTPGGINIMVAVDGSASMLTHWPGIQDAIRALRENNPGSTFGLQIFWGEPVENFEEAMAKNNWCGETFNRVLDVGDHSEVELIEFLGTAPPGPDFGDGRWETSPVVEPLNYYLTNASMLADPARTNYLVFITDGNDNCFGSVFASQDDKLIAYQKLAIELGKLNIRTVPVGFDSATRPGGDQRFGMTPVNTDLEVLQTLLDNGGSGLTEVPAVDDPAKLAEVIGQVGQKVRNCRFEIPDALDPNSDLNPFELNFKINNVIVPRDRRGVDGWNFVKGNTSQVELFGPACQAIQASNQLVASKTCSGEVCGTAAVSVQTRPRAVLMLLDSSASRIECVDGTFDCLVPPMAAADFGFARPLSFWETVERSVAASIAAPINDDVDFGMQFFPGKMSDVLTCDLATEPEIPAADGTEITIMRQMLEKLPLGWSPVVGVMESVAAAPGRLAEPDVLGSVVLLSDGGDNCLEDPSEGDDEDGLANQDVLVERLGAAAKSLLDKQIKTFVVRYGSDAGRTPEQDEQLRALAANSGTATSDPADLSQTPYIDARTEAELNDALASIADQLATCTFTIGDVDDSADRSKTNLYLNGEVIPFDAKGEKQNGWAWTDAEQKTAELYGDSCTAFKTNRRTSVVLEFGCVPIDLGTPL